MDSERIAKVLAIGNEHARIETERDLEGTMATLAPDPVYAFLPVGGLLRGREGVRRYYEHLMDEFLPRVESSVLVDQWCNERALAQEYDVDVRLDAGVVRHRLLGILLVGERQLTGERIYGSEAALRLMLGDLYDALESV
jgi:hypothetical protein